MRGKMKIVFLAQELSGLTGGVIYDEILYKKVKSIFGDSLTLYTDKSFGEEHDDETLHYKRFNKIYDDHLLELTDCDYLFINSRMYTCFGTFPWNQVNKNCKIILIHHHFNFMTQKNPLKYFVHKHLELSFLQRAKKIITPNPYTLNTLNKFGFSERSMLLEAYNTCIDYKDIEDKEKYILFIGTVEPRKGIDLGIDAFYQFSKVISGYDFLIAGTFKKNSAYCKKLLRKVRKYNLQDSIKFLGRISDDVKDQLYRKSKLLLFPSLNEGYGLAIIEAMSYGIPVVAFNNTAMPYTVSNNNGALIPNKNTKMMSSALIKILGNKEEYKRVSAGAKETVLNLPKKDQLDLEYTNFINEIEIGKI